MLHTLWGTGAEPAAILDSISDISSYYFPTGGAHALGYRLLGWPDDEACV